jgi:hypothetical protein
VTSRLQFTTTEECPDAFDQIVYILRDEKINNDEVEKMKIEVGSQLQR